MKIEQKKIMAFTLAEVLITLGIIGVVAAVTMPTLMKDIQGKQFRTKFKKEISILSQAVKLATAFDDANFSSLNEDSSSSTCASDSLKAGKRTMCGLLNDTLKGKKYLGTYGSVYSATTSTNGLDLSNFLLYQLPDGAIVGFNPSAKSCSSGGNAINNETLTGRLASCLGFIDVNGMSKPGKEVTCSNDSSSLNPKDACTYNTRKVSDLFPIVFYDGSIEPATNGAYAVFIGNVDDGSFVTDAQEEPRVPKTVMYNGKEYTRLNSAGSGDTPYYWRAPNGNLCTAGGVCYTKQADGTYVKSAGYYTKLADGTYGILTKTEIYDENMNHVASFKNEVRYDYIGGENRCFTEDANGNRIDYDGYTYAKTDNGYVKEFYGSNFIYNSDMNLIAVEKNGVRYEKKGSIRIAEDANGNIKDDSGRTYTKTVDGYEMVSGSNTYLYDNDGNEIGFRKNGLIYRPMKNIGYVTEDTNGNLVNSSGTVYTKGEDGLYRNGNNVFDEDGYRINY